VAGPQNDAAIGDAIALVAVGHRCASGWGNIPLRMTTVGAGGLRVTTVSTGSSGDGARSGTATRLPAGRSNAAGLRGHSAMTRRRLALVAWSGAAPSEARSTFGVS
jgi:hypothetical protein